MTRLLASLSSRAHEEDASFRTRMLELAASLPDVIAMGRGDPDFHTPAHIVEAAKRAIDADEHHYTHPAGLPRLREAFNATLPRGVRMPTLAALVCASAFDLALHDAYGRVNGTPTYLTYRAPWMNRDLSAYLQPAADAPGVSFTDRYPADFFRSAPETRLLAWHLVGGLDHLTAAEAAGSGPDDGYPVSLDEWIRRDGLVALKVKLRGDDAEWDFRRLQRVAEVGLPLGVRLFTADFNCTVTDPAYVNGVLLESFPTAATEWMDMLNSVYQSQWRPAKVSDL